MMENGNDHQSATPLSLEQDVPTTRKAPSAAEWESKKDTIRFLYITKDLPLRQVVRAMAREHNLKAT
jgi:hypothetical protein